MSRLPNFVIIGSCKSGTTGLYDDLALHPDTDLPSHKEPDILHLASDPDKLRKLYSQHFQGVSADKITGEASTMYTMAPIFEDVSQRALDLFGKDIRLIYLVREPVNRIISHLGHDYASGRLQTTDFDSHVKNDSRYVDWSNYPMQIAPWIERFGLERLRIIEFEHYISNREQVVRDMCEFIDLDPASSSIGQGVSNAKGTQRSMRSVTISKFANSQTYRQLSQVLPSWAVQMAKSIATKQREIPKIELREDTLSELRNQFAGIGDQFEALNLDRPSWEIAR